MKITDVKVHLVHCPIPESERVTSAAGQKYARQAAIVEIATDAGISGIGPVSFGSASLDLLAVRVIVEQVFRPHLLGEDPLLTAYQWERMYRGAVVRAYGSRGLGVAVMSGIDIALWDVMGKAAGLPLYRLLGGYRQSIPAYASAVFWKRDPREAAAAAQHWVAKGFRAVKLKVGADLQSDVSAVRSVREAVGPDVLLMVDGNMVFTADAAIRFGREIEPYDIFFFEEPLFVEDLAGHARVAEALTIPVATGENLTTRFAFRDLIERAGVDVVQADVSRAGGFTEGRRIVELASAHGVGFAPHTFGDGLTFVANLHLLAASPTGLIAEYDVTFNPLMTGLLQGMPHVADGVAQLTERPGLGVELDLDFVARHPYAGEPGIGWGHAGPPVAVTGPAPSLEAGRGS